MELNITTRGFLLKEGARKGIHAELSRIDKMLPEGTFYDVKLQKQVTDGKNLFSCDIDIREGHHFIKGEGTSEYLEVAIDTAVDTLKRRIRKVKTRLINKNRATKAKSIDNMLRNITFSANDMTKLEGNPFEDELNSTDDILRRKSFEVEVMTEEEAKLQLEMLGHTFFAFKNVEGKISILYRRDEGYGLITIA